MAIFKENVKRCGFAMVSNVLIRGYRDLSNGAFRAYCNLLIYAWQGNVVYPSVQQQAEDLGVKERQIQRYLDELFKARLIFREYRNGQTNILWIQDPNDNEVKKYQEKYCKILEKPVDKSEQSYPQGMSDMTGVGDKNDTTGMSDMTPKIEDSLKKKDLKKDKAAYGESVDCFVDNLKGVGK